MQTNSTGIQQHSDCLINNGVSSARTPSSKDIVGIDERRQQMILEDNFCKSIESPHSAKEEIINSMIGVLDSGLQTPVQFFWHSSQFEYRTQHLVGFLLGPVGTYHYTTINDVDYRLIRWLNKDGTIVIQYTLRNQGTRGMCKIEQYPWYEEIDVWKFIQWDRIYWVMKILRGSWQKAHSQWSWDRMLLILDLFRILKIIVGFGNFLKGSTEKINCSEANTLDRYLREACELIDDVEHQFENTWSKSEIMGGR